MKSNFEMNNSGSDEKEKFQKDQNEKLIHSLKAKIKKVNVETKILSIAYEEIKKKNESQQLLQKCIEDLKFEINKKQKDINNFRLKQ